MLKKILQDMYIEPNLLAELDEEQKQLLFFKMRQEQIRRWKEQEAKNVDGVEKKASRKPKLGKDKVQFLNGADGKPWTWVMGEHTNDKSLEEILEAEALLKAATIAKKEAQHFLKTQATKITSDTGTGQKLILQKSNSGSNSAEQIKPLPKLELLRSKEKIVGNEKDDIEKLEQRLSNQIYASLKLERDKSKEKAAEDSKQIEQAWLEQERNSKRVEEERRSLAKTVREVWSNSLNRVKTESQVVSEMAKGEKVASATLPLPRTAHGGNYKNLGKDRPALPSSKEAVIKWFQDVEEQRGAGLDPMTGGIATWFHGVISREETEKLLLDKPVGSFLTRVSDKIWGYAISYKSETRCKQFLIDAGLNGYQFFGLYHVIHSSLADLVKYHEVNPLCVNSQDFLKYPVGQLGATPDYVGLFKTIPEESEDSYL